jgi:hypothetical protein
MSADAKKIHGIERGTPLLQVHNLNHSAPFQTPTLSVLVAEGCVVLRRSTEATVCGIVPKAAWHWGGNSSKRSLRDTGHCTSNVCLPPAWGSAGGGFNSPLLVGLRWTTRNLQKRTAKAIKSSVIQALQLTVLLMGGAIWQQKQPHTCLWMYDFRWIQISSLRKSFMEPSDYDEFRFVQYCTLAEVRDYWRNTADGDAQQIRKWSRCKGCLVRPPHSFSCTQNKSATTSSHCREYSNFYRSHSKRKTSKACISETKAHWTKGRNRYLFTFHLLSIDSIFVEIPYEILMTSLCR